MTLEDLASHKVDWVEPLGQNYRGYRLHEIPPNGQGIGALITLVLLALGAGPLTGIMTRFFEILPLELGSLSRNLAVIVLVTGIGLGTLGSWVSVRSYLLK